ncbi:MAG: DUF5106 domain-containing protein [Muribaculaceae bacterium]|nr:DUF5106 domain-containing protein [Muribaculaceae bacterium]
MRKKILTFGIATLCLVAAAQNVSDSETNVAYEALELPLVPSTLTAPSDRAAYIIEHFWDSMDFAGDERAYDPRFMEQTFVNYLSVFPYADIAAQSVAVDTLMSRAQANPDAYEILADLADTYLYTYDSPMADDGVYVMFADNILSSPVVDDAHKIRPRAHRDTALKNRPGTPAADFAFTDRDGNDTSLYGIDTRGDILLIFYDPDCEHCSIAMRAISSDRQISDKVASGDLAVVAVYSGEDRELWQQRAASLPSEWTVGYEDGSLQDDGLYVIRNLPTVYRLSADKTVLEKEIRY